MTDEELRNSAREFVCQLASGFPAEIEYYANILLEFAKGVIKELEKESAELRKIAEFQQFSNMSRHFENKKLKDTLAVGSIWNKHLNAQNKALEEERDKYRNMVFDRNERFDKAKELLTRFVMASAYFNGKETDLIKEAEQFLKEVKN